MSPFSSLKEASAHASQGDLPWFVHVTSETSKPQYLSAGSQLEQMLSTGYTYAEIRAGSPDFLLLQSLWPGWTADSFTTFDSSGVYSVAVPKNENECLLFLSSPKQHATGHLELDFPEVLSRNLQELTTAVVRSTTGLAHATESAEMCALSIRLMHGEIAKGLFHASHSLMDVKRWLQSEQHLSLVPDEDESFSRYVYIGHIKPSRYAFFCPASRATFSEAEELLKLGDLGLCPRSALILRPDYDENALRAARVAEESTLKLLWKKTSTVLHAVYSFFDYGVDEASRDLQDIAAEHAVSTKPLPSVLGISSSQAAPLPISNVAPKPVVGREEIQERNEKMVNVARGDGTS